MRALLRQNSLILVCLLGGLGAGLAAEGLSAGRTHPLLEIRSLNVNGRPVALRPNSKLRLSAGSRNIVFTFSSATNSPRVPLRIRYKLDGFEENWRETLSDMRVSFRFIDMNAEPVTEIVFSRSGQTENWTGSLETSPFVHRSETISVPAGAKGLWVALSSAGPPTTVGLYAVSNLVVTRLPAGGHPGEDLVRWSPDAKGEVVGSEWLPADWVRNGLRIGMARITPLGPNQAIKALTLLDNDPNAHAEWTTRKEAAAPVSPGERLLLEWDEAYSLGSAGPAEVTYPEPPAGFYRFRLNELSLAGLPGEGEASLAFEIPLALWRTPWFWSLVFLLCLSAAAGAYRYFVGRQMRRELARLESQRALEHERVRIARDIHDDLGARVTQICLVSGLAQSDRALSDKARAEFNSISAMARELVSALYETVWAVSPENDNLDALGGYVCQMVDNLCGKAQLAHRLRVGELPRQVQVPSHVRHNLILAVKEAVHNVIKHARATELSVSMDWQDSILTIRVQDNGCGFDLAAGASGNGLANMQRRLEQAGGTCSLQSASGQGTTVVCRATLKSPA